MATIGAADAFGLPVSTTHVLSSGIAGTMAANRSGLQMSTLRNLLMAWCSPCPFQCCRRRFTGFSPTSNRPIRKTIMSMHEFNRDDTFNQRLLQEFYDSYDEELEMELDDLRFDDAEVDSDQKKAWRKQYFRELLHLQGSW
jgi:hypothetical protein